MRKTILKAALVLLTCTFLFSTLWAQAPQKMSYQAVIRNSSNNLVSMSNIGMQISILQGTENGNAVYVERQFPTTNSNGLVSIEIGKGVVISGVFANIKWSEGEYFIKTETDLNGGANYTITSTSQLLSVPYALHSKTAESAVTESDPIFKAWDKSSGISITESQISDKGTYIETESQNLDNVLTIGNSAGNKTISNLANPVNEQDAVTKAYVDEMKIKLEFLENALIDAGIHPSKFKDSRDSNVYKTVTIGDQIWMAENLKYLPLVVNPISNSTTIPCYYVYDYNGSNLIDAKATINYQTYGVLYNWPAAMKSSISSISNPSGVQGICPSGWHLPSDAEWTQLTDFIGGLDIAGGKLKVAGTNNWQSPNTGATNETGFSAIPGGTYVNDGTFRLIGNSSIWWSSSEHILSSASVYYRGLNYDNSKVIRGGYPKSMGFYVRCIKD